MQRTRTGTDGPLCEDVQAPLVQSCPARCRQRQKKTRLQPIRKFVCDPHTNFPIPSRQFEYRQRGRITVYGQTLGSNPNGSGFPILTFLKSGCAGLSRKFFSVRITALGTSRRAEELAMTHRSPTTSHRTQIQPKALIHLMPPHSS